jgi:hypothetical protein
MSTTLKTISIFSGRFQPPHTGHVMGWHWLNNRFDKCVIATSNVVDPMRSPFNFDEKQTMLVNAGIPADNISQVKNPYTSAEIVAQYDPDTTVIVFGISDKDMCADARFKFNPKLDGTPSYLQSYDLNVDNLQPASKHAYVINMPTVRFMVNNIPMNSATQLRSHFVHANHDVQMQMINDIHGSYDKATHILMKEKLHAAR